MAEQPLPELERAGVLFFARPKGEHDFLYIELPFVQLKLFNGILASTRSSPFPNDLLFFPSQNRPWNWADFELMLPHFHVVLTHSLSLRETPRAITATLSEILQGCQGSSKYLNHSVLLQSLHVYHEDHQYPLSLSLVFDFA